MCVCVCVCADRQTETGGRYNPCVTAYCIARGGNAANRKLTMCVGYIVMISCSVYLVTLTLMQEIGVCVCVCGGGGGGGVGYHIWLQLLLKWTQLLSNFGSLPHSKWVSVCVFLCFFPYRMISS